MDFGLGASFFEPIAQRIETKPKKTRFTSGWKLKTALTSLLYLAVYSRI